MDFPRTTDETEGNPLHNGNATTKLMEQRHLNNVQGDASQGAGAFTPIPASASFPSQLSTPKSSTTNMPSASVAPIMPSVCPSNPTVQVPSVDGTAALRGYAPPNSILPGPTMMQNSVNRYPTPSSQAGSPGQWLPPVSSFSRPPFSAFAADFPGPRSMNFQNRASPVPFPDTQPPGVSSVASVNGLAAPSSVHDKSFTNSVHENRLPVTDEAPRKERTDVWTMHRTETGIPYYYNAFTGQSTYEKPSGFKEEPKAGVQPRPVSWEKLPRTDWMLVYMNDGRKYYYNAVTKLTSWQIPPEVEELKKMQDFQALNVSAVSAVASSVAVEKASDASSLSTPAANTGGRDAMLSRSTVVSGTSSALDLIKRKLQEESTSSGSSMTGFLPLEVNGRKPTEGALKSLQNDNIKDNLRDGDGDADLLNSGSESEEDERSMKEECVLKFKEMLKERGVAPFSKWDKELPKILFDPRFKAIKDHGMRRALFEHYVRTRAEEERKEKRAALKAALDGFKQLLEEAKEDIDHNSDYHSFKKKWGEDPRFKALERKEKEVLINERVSLLRKAVEERTQAARAAAISNFRSMLRDKGDLNIGSRWSKVKDVLKNDPRYKSVRHEDREKLFIEYIDELKAAEERAQKAANSEDHEGKLKERQRALLKRKERDEQEVQRVRQKAHRKEAVEAYQALLVETIKDPQSSWTESKPKLEKDPQGRCQNPNLDKSDMEKLFREHVKTLYERCVAEFKTLLAEVISEAAASQETIDGKTCMTSWSTAKQLLKNDTRYEKMPRKEREIFWRRHADEILRKQKKAAGDDRENKVEDGKKS